MPQISKIKLNSEIEDRIFSLLWKSLSRLEDSDESAEFMSDLLTETERLMVAKRLSIAILVYRGNSPSEIREVLNVSFSTIGSVSGWVKNSTEKTKQILEEVSNQKDWEALNDKLEEIFDKIPPRRNSDWSKAGKEKWNRKKVRVIKSKLR